MKKLMLLALVSTMIVQAENEQPKAPEAPKASKWTMSDKTKSNLKKAGIATGTFAVVAGGSFYAAYRVAKRNNPELTLKQFVREYKKTVAATVATGLVAAAGAVIAPAKVAEYKAKKAEAVKTAATETAVKANKDQRKENYDRSKEINTFKALVKDALANVQKEAAKEDSAEAKALARAKEIAASMEPGFTNWTGVLKSDSQKQVATIVAYNMIKADDKAEDAAVKAAVEKAVKAQINADEKEIAEDYLARILA